MRRTLCFKKPNTGGLYRVFGSPFTVEPTQQLIYLRNTGRRHVYYGYNMLINNMMAMWHGASGPSISCDMTITPGRDAILFNLRELVRFDMEYAKRNGLPPGPPICIDEETHPILFGAEWAVCLYSSFWLRRIALMYRFLRDKNKGSNMFKAEIAYTYSFIFPKWPIRKGILTMLQLQLGAIGCVDECLPSMEAHFERFCNALENHLEIMLHGKKQSLSAELDDDVVEQVNSKYGYMNRSKKDNKKSVETTSLSAEEGERAEAERLANRKYILGTPHPTIADMVLVSYFKAYFHADEPPAELLLSEFPNIAEYVEMVWREDVYKHPPEGEDDLKTKEAINRRVEKHVRDEEQADNSEHQPTSATTIPFGGAGKAAYPDEIPPSLEEVFEVMNEIFPMISSQSEQLSNWYSEHLECNVEGSQARENKIKEFEKLRAQEKHENSATKIAAKLLNPEENAGMRVDIASKVASRAFGVLDPTTATARDATHGGLQSFEGNRAMYKANPLSNKMLQIDTKLRMLENGSEGFRVPQYIKNCDWEMIHGNYVVQCNTDALEVEEAQDAAIEVEEAFSALLQPGANTGGALDLTDLIEKAARNLAAREEVIDSSPDTATASDKNADNEKEEHATVIAKLQTVPPSLLALLHSISKCRLPKFDVIEVYPPILRKIALIPKKEKDDVVVGDAAVTSRTPTVEEQE